MNDDQDLRNAFFRLSRDSASSATADRLARIQGRKPRDRWVPAFGLVLAVPLVVALIGWLNPLGLGNGSLPVGVGPSTTAVDIGDEPDASSETTLSVPRPDGASQEPEAAVRDGVVPAVALLPIVDRVGEWGETPGTSTEEGFWSIGRMNPTAGDDDCVVGLGSGVYGIDFVCADTYGEVLLMSIDGNEILAAYPMPDVPPTWLVVTDEAIYCGRPGTEALPLTALCRIDRSSGEFQVRLFAIVGDGFEGTIDVPTVVDLERLPGTWTVATEFVDSYLAFGQLVDGQVIVDGEMVVDDDLHLTPLGASEVVINPIESGGTYVSSGDPSLDEIALQLIEFARGGEPRFEVAETVTLRLGIDISVSVPGSQLLIERAAWTIDAEYFEGFSGPFDILEILERNSQMAFTAGAVPHCAGPARDYWPAAELVRPPVSITPTDASSCIDWSNVVVRTNGEGVIQEVVLDLFGP
jgi:hypothetical protein